LLRAPATARVGNSIGDQIVILAARKAGRKSGVKVDASRRGR
jgi:hypothetical protein